MKLSWSHKLFLKINNHIGERPRLDKFMYFCGFWLIYILAGFTFALLIVTYVQSHNFGLTTAKVFLATAVLSYLISYFIALLWPHERPIKELPQIKSLFKTLGTWKSFPSDHTIAVTVFALMSFFVTGFSLVSLGFFLGALLVACGRVYGGVHYPRDILGGISVATLAFCVVMFVLYTQQ